MIDAKTHILIVDDNPLNVEMLDRIMDIEGYRSATAFDGMEAIEKAQKMSFDLVLLDVNMPQMDGYEVCQHFKADEKLRDIPVVFLSAVDGTEDKLRGFEVGGVDYITKPFYPNEVLARIKSHLLLRNAQKQLQAKNDQLQEEIAQRKQLQDALKESEKRYRLILENASEAVFTTDRLGFFTYTNPIMVNRSGYRAEELIGKHFTELIDESWGERVLQFYQKQLVQRVHETVLSFPLRKVGDEQVWVEQTANFIMDGDKITGFLGIARDITERKIFEAERERLIAELDAFAHTVAHDLKAPLSIMTINSQILEQMFDQLTEEKRVDTLLNIRFGAHKMADIINALLLLASVRKIESIPVNQLDIAPIVTEALERLATQIAERNVTCVVPEHFPSALGYAPWVEEVLANYISNALKYGGNPPCIEIGADSLSDGFIRYWVKDNGKGLSPDDQAKLFTPFTRLGQIDVEGHGLGLSIVERIVEKLGGTAGVESQLEQGSKFYFTLPASVSYYHPS